MVTVSLGIQRSVQEWGEVEIVSLYKGIPKLRITEGHVWISVNSAFILNTRTNKAYALGLQTVRIIFTGPGELTVFSSGDAQPMAGLAGVWDRFLRSI